MGAWSLDGKSSEEPKIEEVASEKAKEKPAVKVATLVRPSNDPYSSTYFRFEADGNLFTRGGSSTSEDQGWECIREDGNTLYVSKIQGNIQYYEYKIEFVSDDEVALSLLRNDRVLSSNRYKRIVEDSTAESGKSPEAESTEAESPKSSP